jgi:hypothetical protein
MDLAPAAGAGVIRGLIVLALAAPPLAAQTQVLVVSGLGGEPRYRSAFQETALAIGRAARERLGVGPDDVVVLAEDTTGAGIAARSTTEEIAARLRVMAQRGSANDLVLIVLVGHGSAMGGEPRINLPGPDLTAQGLAAMLDSLGERPVVVVNTTSASGDWVAPLSGPRRAIITATRGGMERDETHFGRHFATALASDDADRDKDGRLSLYEAFEYARREVERVYQRDQRLQTEHALLEADGDKVGSRQPEFGTGDGAAAAAIRLDAGRVTGTGAATGLVATRDSLQRAVAALRGRKSSLETNDYEQRLEALLVELALVNRALRQGQK